MLSSETLSTFRFVYRQYSTTVELAVVGRNRIVSVVVELILRMIVLGEIIISLLEDTNSDRKLLSVESTVSEGRSGNPAAKVSWDGTDLEKGTNLSISS